MVTSIRRGGFGVAVRGVYRERRVDLGCVSVQGGEAPPPRACGWICASTLRQRGLLPLAFGLFFLLQAGAMGAQNLTWNASGSYNSSGTWNTTDQCWWNNTSNIEWPNDANDPCNATFQNTSTSTQTITVDGTINVSIITFNCSSVTRLVGGTMNLVGDALIDPRNNINYTINSTITGSNGLTLDTISGSRNNSSETRLGGNNTYTGVTKIYDSALVAYHSNAFGATGSGNHAEIYSNGRLMIGGLNGTSTPLTIPEDIYIKAGGLGACIRSSNANNTLTGNVVYAVDASDSGINVNTAHTFTVSGNITLANGMNATRRISLSASGSTSAKLVVSGIISDATDGKALRLLIEGDNSNPANSGTVELSGNNTFTGDSNGCIIIRRGTLLLSHENAEGSSTTNPIILGDGGTSGSNCILRLLTNGAYTVNNPVNINTGTVAYTAVIGGNSAHESTYIRAITINDANAGTYQLTAAEGGTVTFNGTINDGTQTKAISKIGAGTVVLNKSTGNTYDGDTNVLEGTLLVNNTSGSGTGTGAVSVASGATLGGTGIINGTTTINASGYLTGATNGTTGQLRFQKDLTLDGIYLCDINATNADCINITGNVTLTGNSSLYVNATSANSPSYDILLYTGTRTGTFNSVVNKPSNYEVVYNDSDKKISLVRIPQVLNVTSTNNDGLYGINSTINVTVQFSDNVTVNTTGGTPYLTLNITPSPQNATYISGNGTDTLLFAYNVSSGDEAADLECWNTTALQLNGGSIRNTAQTVNASLTLPTLNSPNSLGGSKNITIDGVAPNVTAYSPTANATNVPVTSNLTLTFSENVTAVAGKNITINVTGGGTFATFNASDTSNVTVSGQNVTIDPPGFLAPNTQYYVMIDPGAFIDVAQNPYAGITENTTWTFTTEPPPQITSVNSTNADAAYGINSTINVTVTFSQNVTVNATGGLPTLTLNVTSGGRNATYTGGNVSDVATLTFTYTVQEDDQSNDLEYLNPNALSLNGATIKNAAETMNVSLVLPTLGQAGSLSHSKNITIDGIKPTVTTYSPSANATSVPVTSNLTLTFSENVTAVSGKYITINASNGTTFATFNASDTSNVTVSGQNVTIDPPTNFAYETEYYVMIEEGAFKDAVDNPYAGILNNTTWSFTTAPNAPEVTLVSSPDADTTYGINSTINVTVTFSPNVTVDVTGGLPTLTLNVTSGGRNATYTGGNVSNVSTLTFTYTVQEGDQSEDLEYRDINALSLNGATIRDVGGSMNALLTLPNMGASGSLSHSKNITIDGVKPTVTAYSPANATTNVPVTSNLTLTFSENVTAVAGKNITINVTGGGTFATFNASDTSNVTVSGQNVTIDPPDLNAGTQYYVMIDPGAFVDGANNPYAGISNHTTWTFTTAAAPTVVNVTSTTADGAYSVGSTINVTVKFSENVTVSGGIPSLMLNITPIARNATYNPSLSTSDTLVFEYTVQAGDTSSDLDYNATNALALNGATIKSAYDVAANVTLPTPGAPGSLGYNKAIVIDTTAPTMQNFNPPDNATNVSISSNLTLTFSEPVFTQAGKNVTIKKMADNSVFEAINVTNASLVSGNGTTSITINPANNLVYNTGYYIEIDSGAFADAAGNAYAGFTGNSTWNITTEVPAPPTVVNVTSTTADGAYSVGSTINVTVKFSENVTVSGGTPYLTLNITPTVRNATYNASLSANETLVFEYTVQTNDTSPDLDYNATNALALNGATIRSDYNVDANVTLPTPGAPGSLGANKNIVIDTTAPWVTTYSPSANATNVPVTSNLTLIFNEAVIAQANKNITINASNGTTFAIIPATDGNVTISGNNVTINPSPDFAYNTQYYIMIDADAFKDAANNSYAGISSSTTWSFTTEAAPAPEMDVSRGGSPVTDGGTDTVTGTVAGSATNITYLIQNSGSASLNLTGSPNVVSSNATNCNVTITQPSSSTIAAGSNVTFGVSITPTNVGNWSFDLSIANNDSDEDPYNWTVSGTASAATMGTLQFASATYSVNEGAGNVTIEVTRTGGTSGAVSANYTIGGGTATQGTDYSTAGGLYTGTVNWSDGDGANKSIVVNITNDLVAEGNETFTVTLSNPTGGATLGAPNVTTVTIVDNDTVEATVTASDPTAAETAAGAAPNTGTFTITLSNPSSSTITVSYSIGGSATVGLDYQNTLGWSVTFDPGETSKTLTVTPIDDDVYEGNEVVTLTLANGTGYTVGTPSSATVTIVDNETAPVVKPPILILQTTMIVNTYVSLLSGYTPVQSTIVNMTVTQGVQPVWTTPSVSSFINTTVTQGIQSIWSVPLSSALVNTTVTQGVQPVTPARPQPSILRTPVIQPLNRRSIIVTPRRR